MTERELIDRLRKKVGLATGRLVVGIGDDCAVYRPGGGADDLLFTTDQMVEAVHFRKGDPLRKVGYKALARGLSDIAAMGGSPQFCLLSIASPSARVAEQVASGLLPLARSAGAVLAGGDVARSRQLTIDIVVCGAVRRGQALLRSGARVGDRIYVSGKLGGAAARNYTSVTVPRIALGKKLVGHASACMDLSDGLSLDLHRLCVASQVAAELDWVPVADGATLHDAFHGGDDYELLFTGRDLHSVSGVEPIGRIVAGEPGTVFYRSEVLPQLGFEHYRT